MDTEIVLLTDILTEDHHRYEQSPDMPREGTCNVKVQVLQLEGSPVKTCARPTNPALTSTCSRRVILASRHQHYTVSMFSYLISILYFVVFTTAELCLDLRVAIARLFDQARPQSPDSDIGTHSRSLVKGQIQSDKHDLSEADLASLQNAVHKEDVKYRAASNADYLTR